MRLFALIVITIFALSSASSAQGTDSRAVLASIDAKANALGDIARQIWTFAEVGYQETKSSALLQQQLRAAGFDVKAGLADIPTSFTATWGSGKPVIGIIGEFDALPGLSQAAQPDRKPITEGGAGHGSGHHLFGTAATAAAIAVKDWLAAGRRNGTLRFYGTPAEEGGSGKVYMLRAGLFDNGCGGDDAPGGSECRQRLEHAGEHHRQVPLPWRLGPRVGGAAPRAVGARRVEAMNAMVNLMREHVPSDARIHCRK